MSIINVLYIIFYFYFISICKGSDLYSDRLIKYDSESFKVNVGESIPHFINLFAPWCRSGNRLNPVRDELAEKYNVDSPNPKLVIGEVEKHRGARSLQITTEMEEPHEERLENEEGNITDYYDSSMPISFFSVQTPFWELTDENFQSTISHGQHFVMFYAPWCGYSINMASAWEELVENFQNDTSVKISSVDCTEHSKACEEFDVPGYPTLLWIVDGKKAERYRGDRNLESFKQFITEMKEAHKKKLEIEEGNATDYYNSTMPPDVSSVETTVGELTDENFQSTISHGQHFVTFYTSSFGYSLWISSALKELAENFQNDTSVTISSVYCTIHREPCVAFRVYSYPTFLWIVDGKAVKKYLGAVNFESFKQFIIEMKEAHKEMLENKKGNTPDSSMPPDVSSVETTVRELTDENFESTISHGQHFVTFYTSSYAYRLWISSALKELAKNFQNDTSVTISSVDCRKHRKACEEFQVYSYPTFFWIVDGKKAERYRGATNSDSFKQFIIEMKEAQLENEEGNITDRVISSATISSCNEVLYITSALYFGGAIFYFIFASSKFEGG